MIKSSCFFLARARIVATMKTDKLLFDDVPSVKSGRVSARCHFVDDGEIRMIFSYDTHLYTYHLNDRSAERIMWVQAYEKNLATYKQISTAIGKAVRTINGWVALYRKNDMARLFDAPRSGAPVKVTNDIIKRIVRLRDQKLKLQEIAQACNISVSSVRNVLDKRKRKNDKKQSEITFKEVEAEPVVPESKTEKDEMPENESEGTDSPEPENVVVAVHESKVEDALSQDRSLDRLAASKGIIQEAKPLFGNCDHAEWAGAFMGVALLSEDACLKTGLNIYDSFSSAFYGLRTMIVIWVLMALLRIKCSENIRKTDVRRLGRIVGLDRAPEVKTIRRKLHELIEQDKAFEWMKVLAEERVAELAEPVKTIQVDGHIVAYCGKQKIGTVYSSRTKQVTKGQTENWVNLPDGGGLFMVTSPFNEGLTGMLEKVVKQACEVCGVNSLNLVFDRGGYNTEVFDRLIKSGHHIITYRKGSSDDVPLTFFKKEKTTIGNNTYEYAPYERVVELNIYKNIKTPKGAAARKKTKRTLKLREIRIVRKDQRQTAILTSIPAESMETVTVASNMFDRTGNQENYFKYMREEYLMDAKGIYQVKDITDNRLTHPNPAYVKMEKKRAKLAEERKKLLAKYATGLIDTDPEKIAGILNKQGMKDQADKISGLNKKIKKLTLHMDETPDRENVSQAKYKKLDEQARTFQYCLKMSACHIEDRLVDMLADHYKNSQKEGRSLIVSALKTSGSIRLEPGRLVIRLDPQSSRIRTRAINRVLLQLNEMKAEFPGSKRVINFELTPEPIPVLHNI